MLPGPEVSYRTGYSLGTSLLRIVASSHLNRSRAGVLPAVALAVVCCLKLSFARGHPKSTDGLFGQCLLLLIRHTYWLSICGDVARSTSYVPYTIVQKKMFCGRRHEGWAVVNGQLCGLAERGEQILQHPNQCCRINRPHLTHVYQFAKGFDCQRKHDTM